MSTQHTPMMKLAKFLYRAGEDLMWSKNHAEGTFPRKKRTYFLGAVMNRAGAAMWSRLEARAALAQTEDA